PAAAAPAASASPPTPAAAAANAPPPRAAGYSKLLSARVPGGAAAPGEDSFAPIGSLDSDAARFRIRFHPRGAGISEIVFSEYWKHAEARAAFEAHERAVKAGAANPPPLPADSERYVLSSLQRFGGNMVPLLAAIDCSIDGEQVKLLDDVWAERAPGVFSTEIVDDAGAVVLVVERRFELAPGGRDAFGAGFDLALVHRFENRTARELRLAWSQCGPGDLTLESGGFMDTRRFQFGYLFSAARDPSRQSVIVHGATEERSTVLSRIEAGSNQLWPTKAQLEAGYEMCWFGTTNRYFSLAVHGGYRPPTQNSKSVAGVVAEVAVTADLNDPVRTIFSTLRSPAFSVAPASTGSLDLFVYAGPLDPRVLDRVEPYAGLNLGGLILYQISGCCSWCTFAWLATLIVQLLMFLHDWVVFDWGLAIIVLVVIVRVLLHPLTKYSQVNMQRFARGMQELKPQLDALKQRHGDDPQRLQVEQMRLYREKGVNPVGCLGGILPTFLQTPIWIALYAVLYFAFDLRQQSAFFGVFQSLWGWRFLGDLSAPDNFIVFPSEINLWLFTLQGINLIPLLMGVVFWISQKYMTPPPTTKLTPEQEQQQKMMKWMMVIIFPIGLFKAPAGLTLYILTSTIVGIFEGKRVREQIKKMDLAPKAPAPKKKSRDLMGRMYAEALERARQKQKGPPKKFKDRG
ncbi:MAG: membrane protein insertase YidC, partial [Phycisphaerae bacterium]|nr:membrane protein insertase YidC [Phycisphaerae bacterium]